MRKPTQRLLSIIAAVLFTGLCGLAQEQQSQSTDFLREKIVQLEKTDISARARSVQDIYKRTLLRFYSELASALQEDIAALKNIQSAIGNTDAAQRNEISAQLKALVAEQTETSEKIQMMNGGLQAGAPPEQAARAPLSSASRSRSSLRTPAPRALAEKANATKAAVTLPEQDSNSTTIAATDEIPPEATETSKVTPAPIVLQGDCYPNVPEIIATNIDAVAKNIVRFAGNVNQKASRYSARHEDIFFYTVADAIAPDNEANNIRALKAYQFLGETARTDKQIGASAKSEGSTTAVEKPGFADLLGWAVEHGAIQQAIDGTTLTLSTSPYALVAAANGGDTAANYQEYDFLNRIGISASFNIGNNDSVLANARRKQLDEWSVRVRLSGDRSTRSKQFEDFWNRNIRSKVRARLLLLNRAGGLLENDPKLGAQDANGDTLSERVNADIRGQIIAILNTADPDEKKTADIKKVILCNMRQSVYDAVIERGDDLVSAATRTTINSNLIPALFKAHEDLVQARSLIRDFLDEAGKKPLMTFAYNNHRTEMGSDYSVFRFLYERNTFKPMKMVANGGISFYHRPDSAINQQSIRDIALALSFEGKVRSPFMTSELDFSNITYSFSGRYERMMENRGLPNRKADIAVAQFKVEFPVLAGMSLPFSITYANASELIKEDHVRANFGFTFDASKLLALRKLAQLVAGGQ
jgi:hypothetical protein